jgi:hypothetical protein
MQEKKLTILPQTHKTRALTTIPQQVRQRETGLSRTNLLRVKQQDQTHCTLPNPPPGRDDGSGNLSVYPQTRLF